MSVWLAVKVRRGLTVPQTHRAYEIESTCSFGDLSQRLDDLREDERIVKIEIRSSASSLGAPSFKMEVRLETPIAVCSQFSAFMVEFTVQTAETMALPEPVPVGQRLLTSVLMGNANMRGRPAKTTVNNNYDKLYNYLIDYLEEINISWSTTVISSTGKKFVSSLTSLLWHITCHHDRFSERAASLPNFVEKFANYNDFAQKHHSKPKLDAKKLRKYIDDMVTFLTQPWMLKNASFLHDLNVLVEACQKVANQMEQYATKHLEKQHSVTSYTSDNVSTTVRDAVTGPVSLEYKDVDNKLETVGFYEPVHLTDFEQEDRYKRRHWIDNLRVSCDIGFTKKSYGGRVGNINVIWKVNRDDEDHETNMAKAVLLVNKELPDYHTRQMKKDFIDKYNKLSKLSRTAMREIYQELTGDDSKPLTKHEENRRGRLVEIIASHDDQGLVQDMRLFNGKDGSTVYEEFWNEVQSLFDEYTASVHERRHGSVLYLPFAISIRELIEKVKKRKPDVKVPSEEWVRLQFQPKNPCSLAAMAHTGRFDIKYQVQRRQMRGSHDDSKYVFHQQRYVKAFAVRYRAHTILISADDKAVIPIGEPEHAVSTGVRAHNQSLGPSDPNAAISALDHDWKIAGIVPSVNLFVEIPESTRETFFSGQPIVTVKDRVFQKSSPLRHGTELSAQIKNRVDDFWKSVLMLITDGGGDHNITHASVQASLLALFVDLDLDFLCAMRTCPTQSWTNLAERVMSILNIALQHCALEREKMSDLLEDIIKKCNSMCKLRSEASQTGELQEAFASSLQSVISLVQGRFESMKLKENHIQCAKACSDADVDTFFKCLHQIDENIDREKLTAADLSSIEGYTQFVADHCKSTTYTYQIRKCANKSCTYCTLHPVRLPADVFEEINFIPAPLLDSSKEHYMKFDEAYGKTVTEKDRPSLKFSLELVEEDNLHKNTLVAQKVRAVIKCASCMKPRCMFSNSKFNNSVQKEVKSIIEENTYICGGNFADDDSYLRHSVVVRRQLSCSQPIETTYYSSKLALPEICFHCGSSSGAALADLTDMLEKFSQVRPLCVHCKAKGLKPATRAPVLTHSGAKKKK